MTSLLTWDQSQQVSYTNIQTKLGKQCGYLPPVMRLVIKDMHKQAKKLPTETSALRVPVGDRFP